MVAQDLNGAEDGTPNATGESNDTIRTIPNRRDAVQRALNASAIISAKITDARDHPRQILFGYLALKQCHVTRGESRLWSSAKVHDDLKESVASGGQLFARGEFTNARNDFSREAVKEEVEIVDDRLFLHDRGLQCCASSVVGVFGKAHWRNPSAATE
jgi:hypothetical protein